MASMRDRVSSPASAYALAVVATAVAVAVRWLIDPWLGEYYALVTVFAAVAVAVWLGGYGPALLAAILGYLACEYLFIAPRGSFGLYSTIDIVGLLAFVVSCAILIALGEGLRRARYRAREREELFRVTFASIGDAVITTDTKGRIERLNAVAESLTGWTQAESVGRPLDQVFRIQNEQSGEKVASPVERVLREGVIVGLANHTVLITKGGSARPIDDSAAPVRDARGRLVGCVLVFRDVTERRRAELALQRSERELNDFFENATIGLHWTGPDGVILRANQAELDLLGYRREEFVGHRIAEFHVDPAVAEKIMGRLVRGEAVREHPAGLRCKDGSIRDVLVTSSALFEDGRFVRSRCFTIDVTDRKRAERDRALLAAIVADSSDAIVGKSLDGTILSWNAGAERLLGYTAAEAVGQSIYMLIPPHLHDEERSILERLRRGERIEHFETVRVSKGGRLVDISLTVSPVRDETGRIFGASKVARDITERKRAEDALRRSEARFRELANNIDQFAWTCNELGYVTWYNDRWYEYTGTSFAEMQGMGWKAVHHPDHVERVLESLMRAAAAGKPWEDTFPLRGKDGRYRWFLSRAVPIRDDDGDIVRWFGTNTDITEQRRLEESLRDADRRKDEFVATLAHELRNPLAPVRNAVRILLEQEFADSETRWALDVIERQVQQMVRLLEDLLDASRISHNKLILRKERTDLETVLTSAVESSRFLIDAAGHELTVSLPRDPVYLDADPVRLAQVFANLLNNAAKYTDDGGHIEVAAEVRGDQVLVTVKDDGVGIAPDLIPRIFEIFTQDEGVSERSDGGLGIGLALVRGLVALHGGSVEAHSAGNGKGSEFAVRLPLAAAPSSVARAPRAADQPGKARRLRLLIADDRADNADTLALLLRTMGHEVHTAYDGEEAVRTAAEVRPEAILLDIGMPNLNGYEASRKIRQQPWARDTVLIALTGWGQADDRRRSEDAGFDHHLVKPLELSELLRLLNRVPAYREAR